MALSVEVKNIVQHLANGTLDKLCLICLEPLKENNFESIYTLICKEETNYCVADALEAVCQLQFEGTENHNVCIDCFISASDAYKFHLQAKHSMEIISHYTGELLSKIENVEVPQEDTEKLLCIQLCEFVPETRLFDFDLDGIGRKYVENDDCDDDNDPNYIIPHNVTEIDQHKVLVVKEETSNFEESDVQQKDKPKNLTHLKTSNKPKRSNLKSDEILNPVNYESDESEEMLMIINEKKIRKKRDKMVYMSCSRCPVKYRFVSKLKDHMKTNHDIDIYYCKICKIVSEHKNEYEEHLKTHRGRHQCTICYTIYKKADTLTAHMKLHEEKKDLLEDQLSWAGRSETANICEQCGAMLADEASLHHHMSTHAKNYACYYCGRMYKGEGSFERHVRKHEEYWRRKDGKKSEQASSAHAEKQDDKNKRSFCQTCGKDFVDERSLLWHQRLHNNDRPFTCDVCGRSFVTKNRRNQHALCAHTPPTRRCPLCPALFHLRSMVNTHVKKVHLTHKRRHRRARPRHVYWRTEPVPIQDLSVDLQAGVLELRAEQDIQVVNEPTSEENSMLFL